MINSPLRYPGGKAKLFSFFTEIFKSNNLYNHVYCEPYAGGAGLALKLLTGGFVDRIALNDVDFSIFCFWRSALYNTSKFCAEIANTPISVEEWRKQRDIWRNPNRQKTFELGFATYFLNRTSRSGIIDGSGPIGGFDQAGQWKIDARFPKDKQIDNFHQLARFSSQIEISNVDAFDFVSAKFATDSKTLIYLDPPYYIKGSKLYTNFYVHEDHERVRDLLLENDERSWVCSYDDVEEIRNLYASFDPISYRLSYSAGTKTVGSEVMFFSKNLRCPRVRGYKNMSEGHSSVHP